MEYFSETEAIDKIKSEEVVKKFLFLDSFKHYRLTYMVITLKYL